MLPWRCVSQHTLQGLIRQKLADGRLPLNNIPRVWGGPGHGELCDACDEVIAKDALVIEGMSFAEGRSPLRLHIECFYLWQQERGMMPAGPTPQR